MSPRSSTGRRPRFMTSPTGGLSEDFVPLEDLLQPTMDEIDAIASNGGISRGVPTGFTELDEVTNGLHPGQMIIVAARPGVGKRSRWTRRCPRPTAGRRWAEVAVGDELLGDDGQPTRVVAATDVMLGRPCYEVEFSDGTVIVADAEHQWLTETRASRKSAQAAATGYNRYKNQRTFAAVRTTAEIAGTFRCDTADQRINHSVTNAARSTSRTANFWSPATLSAPGSVTAPVPPPRSRRPTRGHHADRGRRLCRRSIRIRPLPLPIALGPAE